MELPTMVFLISDLHLNGFNRTLANPSRVTLMGESAGGGSTIHQITAYGGLKGPVPFRQAISQSGAWLPTPYPIQQENIFNNFLSKANVSTLQEARALSTEDLQLVNWQLVGEATYGDYTFSKFLHFMIDFAC
jgi:carboxylesterase type B